MNTQFSMVASYANCEFGNYCEHSGENKMQLRKVFKKCLEYRIPYLEKKNKS